MSEFVVTAVWACACSDEVAHAGDTEYVCGLDTEEGCDLSDFVETCCEEEAEEVSAHLFLVDNTCADGEDAFHCAAEFYIDAITSQLEV